MSGRKIDRTGICWDGVSAFGRIRLKVGFWWILSSPAGGFLAYFAVSMSILILLKLIPDSDRFGSGSDSGGFGRIPGPWNRISPTQAICSGPTQFADLEARHGPRQQHHGLQRQVPARILSLGLGTRAIFVSFGTVSSYKQIHVPPSGFYDKVRETTYTLSNK